MGWRTFALGSAFFAGLTAVLAKVGVKNIPSNFATLIRTIVIIIFLIGLVGWRDEWRNPLSIPHRSLIFLVLSGLATGLSWLCYYRALQLGPVSMVSPIDKLSLVIAILFSVSLLGERLTSVQWFGTAFVVVGVLMLSIK